MPGPLFKLAVLLAAIPWALSGQVPPALQTYIAESSPVLLLRHVRIIDGTGAPAREDQAVLIADRKVAWLGPDAAAPSRSDAKVLDERDRTLLPGLVMLHEHLFTTSPSAGEFFVQQQGFSFPKLYLAAGVTTMRTGGSIEPYMDLQMKRRIDRGEYPGPKIFLTGPYLEGDPPAFAQADVLRNEDDARRSVNYWAAEGMTSFKAYMNITRAQLGAAISEAHRHGLKLTGHLCSVGFREAADLGIDNLEHGLVVDTEFYSKKQPDKCSSSEAAQEMADKLDIQSAPVQDLIKYLISRHVAITSTLPVFEEFEQGEPLQSKLKNEGPFMSDRSWAAYVTRRGLVGQSRRAHLLKKEGQFEKAFFQAGGVLLAGSDPTGIGGTIAGFGDHRELELLVQAGLAPLQAIHVATQSGAVFLDCDREVGTVAVGKRADLMLVKGDPSKNISDIRNVELVMKDGLGYNPAKLLDSVRTQTGQVGLR